MNLRFALFFFSHYGFLALLALFACLIGLRLTASVSYSSVSEKFSFCTALGLGVIAYLVFALGIIHLLTPVMILAVFGVIAISLAQPWRELTRDASRFWQSLPTNRRVLYGFIPILAIPVLLLPLYPPTQWDATSYHLAAAKIYVHSHAIVFTPYLRFPVFPQMNEMLFALTLALYDDLSAQLVQFLMMLVVAIALFAWGRRAFNARVGLWSAVLWLSNPLVIWLGASAYIDVGLTMFVTLAMYAFLNWYQSRSAPWLVISAALFGFAAGTKYLALFPILCFGFFLLCLAARERKPRDFFVFSAIVLITAGPWYIRNVYYTGNPVWPYFGSMLGYGTWSPADVAHVLDEQTSHGSEKGILSLLRLPWNLAFPKKIDIPEARLSSVYLFLLPLCLIAAIRDSCLRVLLFAAGLYTLFWFSTVQVLRYLLPAVPVLSLAAAAALEKAVFYFQKAKSTAMARSLTGAVCCLILLVPGWATPRKSGLIPHYLPPVKTEARASYLEHRLPLYSSLEFLNGLKGDNYTVYALGYPNMAYFADGRFIGDDFGPARYELLYGHFSQPAEIYRELRRLGANYLLIHADHADAEFSDKLTDSVLSHNFLEGHFKLIYAHSTGILFEVDDGPAQLVNAPELLNNAGFEQPGSDAPAGWTAVGKPSVDSTGANSHSGKSAVRSDGTDWQEQKVPVTGGAVYLLRHFSRAARTPGLARLQINWLDRNRIPMTTDIEIVPADTRWDSHAMAAKAPAKAVWADIFASVSGNSVVWFDDFSFIELRYK